MTDHKIKPYYISYLHFTWATSITLAHSLYLVVKTIHPVNFIVGWRFFFKVNLILCIYLYVYIITEGWAVSLAFAGLLKAGVIFKTNGQPEHLKVHVCKGKYGQRRNLKFYPNVY